MEQVIDDDQTRIPIKVWAAEVDATTERQARNLANLPFAVEHIALMPDAHAGYGMPIGGVLAAKDHVVPNAIGVDIGCGMHARRTNIEVGRLRERQGKRTVLAAILQRIHRAVPTGVGAGGSFKLPRDWEGWRQVASHARAVGEGPAVLQQAFERARTQIGTLGSGNHFIEVQEDEQGFAWVMLHSGSRSIGHAVCTYYNGVAQELNAREGSAVPASAELAYLHTDSEEGQAYLAWMRLCMDWALENRRRMLDTCVEALFAGVRGVAPDGGYLVTEAVDTHHNYAVLETHYGQQVLVHRKGAVRARAGELVIVPGSMETGSYVARGLGNPESFTTSAHGAGRRLSRTAARAARSVDDMLRSLDAKGIELETNSKAKVLDEAGHAYKDVDEVMTASRDLVEPVYALRPLGVVKG